MRSTKKTWLASQKHTDAKEASHTIEGDSPALTKRLAAGADRCAIICTLGRAAATAAARTMAALMLKQQIKALDNLFSNEILQNAGFPCTQIGCPSAASGFLRFLGLVSRITTYLSYIVRFSSTHSTFARSSSSAVVNPGHFRVQTRGFQSRVLVRDIPLVCSTGLLETF